MPDLQSQPPNAQAKPSDIDPLASLHKMSTTAGLGSGDYVAINSVAIAAGLLGFASLLAKLNNALLVIPVAGVICGVIALRQIASSSGTQTGRAAAWGGLVLSLALGGWVVTQQVVDSLRTRDDEQKIAHVINLLGDHVKAADYDKAYAMFGQRFHDRVTLDKFKEQLAFFTSPNAAQLYGKMNSIDWNGQLAFYPDPQTGDTMAVGVGLMRMSKLTDPARQSMTFRKTPAGWQIEDMPDLFPPPGPKR